MAASPAVFGIAEPAPHGVCLLDVEPDLGRWIRPDELADARNATRLLAVELAKGPFEPEAVFAAGRRGFGGLVVSGLVTRQIPLGGQPSLRLLGPGELFLAEPEEPGAVGPRATWSVLMPATVAVLDDHLLAATRRWPRLTRGICSMLQQSHEETLLQMAISHQPRVEDRVSALFRLLAARWGHVTMDGVVVPIALTHEVLGRMVGARRPTVTLALGALADQGLVRRISNDRWLLGENLIASGDLAPVAK